MRFCVPGHFCVAESGHGRIWNPPLQSLKNRLVGRGLDPSAGRRGRRPLHRFNACFGPVCRGRACPARQSAPLPVHGSPVGEGFIPPGHLPPPRTSTGGSRPSPTNCPEMCAYQNAAGRACPAPTALQSTKIPVRSYRAYREKYLALTAPARQTAAGLPCRSAPRPPWSGWSRAACSCRCRSGCRSRRADRPSGCPR